MFWKEYRSAPVYSVRYDWRCYKGRARLRSGRLHIYPCNGQRRKLSEFIAFDDSKSNPPFVLSSAGAVGALVDQLVNVGAIAQHLPPTYIDAYGNIRRTDSTLSLVLMGPNWDSAREAEFQRAIDLPF